MQSIIAEIALGSGNFSSSSFDNTYVWIFLKAGFTRIDNHHQKFDYYLSHYLKILPFQTLLQVSAPAPMSFNLIPLQIFRHVPHFNCNSSAIGKYMISLLFKWASETSTDLGKLVPYKEVPESIKGLKVQQNLQVMVYSELESLLKSQHGIFDENYFKNLPPFHFKPTYTLGPDSVLLLTNNNEVVGFLVVHGTNQEKSLGLTDFVNEALPTLNPTNFYNKGKNVTDVQSWKALYRQLKTKKCIWVRVCLQHKVNHSPNITCRQYLPRDLHSVCGS